MRDEYAKVRYKERIKSGYTCEGVKAVVLPAQQTIQQRSTTHRNHSTAQYNAQKPFNSAVQRTDTIQQHSKTHRNQSTMQYNAQKLETHTQTNRLQGLGRELQAILKLPLIKRSPTTPAAGCADRATELMKRL